MGHDISIWKKAGAARRKPSLAGRMAFLAYARKDGKLLTTVVPPGGPRESEPAAARDKRQ
jgi:hypothetical protein